MEKYNFDLKYFRCVAVAVPKSQRQWQNGMRNLSFAASISRALAYLRALKLATHIGNKKDKCLHAKNKVLFSGLKIKDRILSC